MKVVLLTTSYPRDENDFAGRFIADAVERLVAKGVEVNVLGPARYRHFGLGAGEGIMRSLRRRPWAGPPLVVSMLRSLRREARDADLVHAHWLPSGAVASRSGKPFVVTLHGSDVELARRAPRIARAVLRRARGVICVSKALAEEAWRLGAEDPRVVPNGIELPREVGEEADPPEVLFAGRLSREKGIEDLLAVADGFPLVVAGDGPLRHAVPGALGMVPRPELNRLYSRAALIACPSHREGFGVACAKNRYPQIPRPDTAIIRKFERTRKEICVFAGETVTPGNFRDASATKSNKARPSGFFPSKYPSTEYFPHP